MKIVLIIVASMTFLTSCGSPRTKLPVGIGRRAHELKLPPKTEVRVQGVSPLGYPEGATNER